MRRAALLLAASLATAAPAAASANTQLATSVQHTLDSMGYDEVDARALTTRQLAALHLHFSGNEMSDMEGGLIAVRQRVEIILGWD